LEIILHAEPEMTPQPVTGEHRKVEQVDEEEDEAAVKDAADSDA
jgi:hypothetical protein